MIRRTESRPSPLSIRITREERVLLERLAGNVPLGAFIKYRIFADSARPTKRGRGRTPARDQRLLAQLLGGLGASRIAGNLNQLARAASSGSLVCDERTRALIAAAQSDLSAMRDMLTRALGLKLPPPPQPHAKPNPTWAFTVAANEEAET